MQTIVQERADWGKNVKENEQGKRLSVEKEQGIAQGERAAAGVHEVIEES